MEKVDSTKKGFAIVYAMLVSGVVLAVAAAMASIAAREVILSSFSRDSQAAYFAADAGVNCALWYDLKMPSVPSGAFSTTTGRSITCNGQTFNVGGATPSQFTICFSDGSSTGLSSAFKRPYSAEVKVWKEEVDVNNNNLGGDNYIRTKIESRGYNTCDPTNTRRVERAIRVSY